MKNNILSNRVVLVIILISFYSYVNMFAQNLIWSDEFDGASLDVSKWEIVDAGDWDDCWYAPHNVEVSNGTLKLHSKEESHNGKNWTGAKIEGKYHPKYKYLEARVRHSEPDTKIWSAWWAIGWEDNTWKWPPEFDIHEFAPQWENSPIQVYHWGHYSNPSQDGKVTGFDESEWHTYGVYWNHTQAPVFYLDSIISFIPDSPADDFQMEAFLLLSSSPNRDDHYSGCPLGIFEVDYVRVYDNPPEQPVPNHLAYQKPAASSSNESSMVTPDKAVDGDVTTRWASQFSNPQWIRLDLEAVNSINKVILNWETAYGKEYKIQVADNPEGPWTDCIHVTQNTGAGLKTHEFPDKSGRYIRIYCIQRATEWGYSLYEIEVYYDNSVIVSPNPTGMKPKNCILKQNYPNPFNPTTAISYQIHAGSDVELTIYNITGKMVTTLVSERQPAGNYKYQWDASGFASGVYYYSLKTSAGIVLTRKLVLLK